MIGILKSAIGRARLELLRREQLENLKLRTYFSRRHGIEVGLYSYGCFDAWRMPGPMRIGRYCSIAKSARVVPNNHPMSALTTHPLLYELRFGLVETDIASEPLVIEDDVWIGHDVVLLPGCKFVGRGAVIGAGAIVTSNVERYTVVAGNPARRLRDRYPAELAAVIDESRWWELDIADLRRLGRERPDVVFEPTVQSIGRWLSERTPARVRS